VVGYVCVFVDNMDVIYIFIIIYILPSGKLTNYNILPFV
jgi:hypothetical protein